MLGVPDGPPLSAAGVPTPNVVGMKGVLKGWTSGHHATKSAAVVYDQYVIMYVS